MELEIKSISGSKASGHFALRSDIADAKFNEALIHQVVTAYLAGARQGTKAQKNRSAVSGGGAKPWRQKGTGRARAGTSRGPIWRSGGVTFAATPRDYSQKVNRKSYKAAIRSIFAELVRQERLIIVNDLSMSAPKTKELATSLNALDAKRTLLIDVAGNENLVLSARNIPYTSVISSSNVNPLDLVNHDSVVVSAQAMNEIQEKL